MCREVDGSLFRFLVVFGTMVNPKVLSQCRIICQNSELSHGCAQECRTAKINHPAPRFLRTFGQSRAADPV